MNEETKKAIKELTDYLWEVINSKDLQRYKFAYHTKIIAKIMRFNSSMLQQKYIPKKRWIEFKDKSFLYPEKITKTINIFNKDSKDNLGVIKWSPTWRQYVFDDGHIILSEGCLYELFEKIRELRLIRDSHNKRTKGDDKDAL